MVREAGLRGEAVARCDVRVDFLPRLSGDKRLARSASMRLEILGSAFSDFCLGSGLFFTFEAIKA